MEKVALYRKGEYIVGRINDDLTHFFVELDIHRNCKLSKEYGHTKELLDKYPQVKYEETETCFLVSPGDSFYEKVSLPVVVKYFDNYRYIGKNHEAMVLKDTEISNYYYYTDRISEEVRINKLKEQLGKDGGISFVSAQDAALLDDMYCYPIGIYGYVVVDVENLTSLQLTLKVPRYIVGRVVGKGGATVKAIAHDVRVDRINVVPI